MTRPHTPTPRLNSSFMIFSVDGPTLYMEFWHGYDGVMMGMRSRLSEGFIRGSHTRCPSPSSTISVSITGLGHFHMSHRMKNLVTSVGGMAFG